MRNATLVMLLVALLGAPALAQDQTDPTLDLPVHPSLIRPAPAPAPPPATQAPAPAPAPAPPITPPVQPPPPPEPHDEPRDAPAPVFYGEEIDTETDSIFYVIDVSGSMGEWITPPRVETWYPTPGSPQVVLRAVPGTGTTRLDNAKRELSRSVGSLSPNLRFNLLAFDCSNRLWQRAMVPASDQNKAVALAWIGGLMPGGSTGTASAVVAALAQDRGNRSVVLLTDGDPNCGKPLTLSTVPDVEWHRARINDNNTQRAVITVFGIQATSLMREFCQHVADDSGGSYYDVR